VVSRLLAEAQRVVATGGGAFMNPATRERIAERGISLWLKADAEILLRRVRKRSNRPLLSGQDAEQTLRRLIEERYPIYGLADLRVESRDGPHELMVEDVLLTLDQGLGAIPRLQATPSAKFETPLTPPPEAPPGPDRLIVHAEPAPRGCEIVIANGLLAEAGSHVSRLAPGAACAIVTDTNIAQTYLPALETSLMAAGIRFSRFVAPAGEAAKSWPVFSQLCDHLVAATTERNDLVLALGGGAVCDLAGFAAACVRHGMRVAQLPTSLVAQVESAVGGKASINSQHGRNLIGLRNPPSLVLIDTATLASLPLSQFRAGYAEIVKHALIGDATLMTWLERHWREVFDRAPALAQAIAGGCRARAAILARDESGLGDRALLSLGQIFAKPLQSLALSNGERLSADAGTSIGMSCAFRFSVRLGLCPPGDTARVEAHFRQAGLPAGFIDVPGWRAGPDAILSAMSERGRTKDEIPPFILARGIGAAFVARDINEDELLSFLRQELEPDS